MYEGDSGICKFKMNFRLLKRQVVFFNQLQFLNEYCFTFYSC